MINQRSMHRFTLNVPWLCADYIYLLDYHSIRISLNWIIDFQLGAHYIQLAHTNPVSAASRAVQCIAINVSLGGLCTAERNCNIQMSLCLPQ